MNLKIFSSIRRFPSPRFHKWAIPLTWVLGLGLAIPAGALAIEGFDMTTNTRTCTIWHGRDGTGSGFYVQLSAVIVGFFIPLLVAGQH